MGGLTLSRVSVETNTTKTGFDLAQDYLELLMDPESAKKTVSNLRKCKTFERPLRLIARAAHIEVLPEHHVVVRSYMRSIEQGRSPREDSTPLLLVRGEPLIVAYGWELVCAEYHITTRNFDDIDDVLVSCRLGNRSMNVTQETPA